MTLSEAAAADVTVDWATSVATGDSAESGDFTAVAATALTFTAGQTAKTLTVATTEDTTDEEDETFTVTLSNPSSNAALATGATAKGTIEDDDDPPSVGIGRSAGSEAGGELIPTLELSAASEKTVTVTWTASIGSGDTAVAADFEDLSAATGTAEIAPGTKSASLRTLHPHVFDDALDEPDETFTVTLSNPVNATLGSDPTATMTIEDDDPTPTVTVADAAASEGGNVAFVVTLSAVSGRDVEVDYATSEASPQSAVSGTDFTPASGTLTIEAGEGTGTIEVAATEDDDEEDDETFTLTISNPENATLTTDTTATGTINNRNLPALSVEAAAAAEGEDVEFTVELSAADAVDVTFTWTASIETDDTAATGDFTDLSAATGTLTIAAGDETVKFTVPTAEDAADEADETFTVTLSGVSANAELGTGATAQGTIRDDDPEPSLSVEDAAADEGEDVEFTVTLDPESGRQVTVAWATSVETGDTATSGTDFTAVPATTLTFTAGQTAKTLTVDTTEDAIDEVNETFTLTLSDVSNATLPDPPTAQGTIRDDDKPVLRFAASSVTIEDSGRAEVALELDRPGIAPIEVHWEAGETSPATAEAGVDFEAATGTVTFAPGETEQDFLIRVIDDNRVEDTEKFLVTLRPADRTLVKVATSEREYTIVDVDDLKLSLDVETVVDEDAGAATITVYADAAPVDIEFQFDYETQPGTVVPEALQGNDDYTAYVAEAAALTYAAATEGADYRRTTGTLTFGPGAQRRTITVPLVDDGAEEDRELFQVWLVRRKETDRRIQNPGRPGRVVIEASDVPVVSVGDAQATEGDPVEFTVRLSPASGREVTVDWAASAEPGDSAGAGDFTAANGALTFTAGERSKTVRVATTGDSAAEDDETFTLRLSNATNAMLATPTATGTITDDDAPPPEDLEAEAVAGSYTRLKVRWGTPPPAAGLVLTGYELRYREHPEGAWTDWPHAGLATAATITGLQVDTAYDIEVRAVYGELRSVWVRVPGSVRTAAPEPAVIRSVAVVTGPGSDGVWSTGEWVEVEVRYDKPVVVEQPEYWENTDGDRFPPGPYVLVVFNSDARLGYGQSLSTPLAPYVGGSGTATLRFAYQVQVGAAEDGALGAWAAHDGMLLRGATIRTLKGGEGASRYTNTRVLQVTVEPRSGAWTAGDRVRVKVGFAGPVQYTPPAEPQNLDEVVVDETGGTPTIGLLLGDPEQRGLARTASYERGSGTSGTDTLTFEYAVTGGDGRVSAVEVVADSLARNGATIRNEHGYDAELDHLGTLWYSWRTLQVRDAEAAREGGTLRFTMELSRASEAAVAVDYETADGTATAGKDYTAQRDTKTFAPGQTRQTVAVPVLRDEEAEDAETVVLRLSNARAEGSQGPVEVTVGEAEGMIEDVAPQVPAGGLTALTASFVDVPAEHDGESAFTLRIAFSEPLSWMNGRRLREDVVAVAGGRATKAGRVNRRRDLWELTVEPDSLADVTVTLAGGAACDSPAAVCTSDGRALSNTISATVRGPVTVSVADARVREAPGATLDFAVTLSRAAAGAVTVAYRTVDGSARAGSDYTARQGKLTFAAGETEQTVRVAVLDDAVDEGEETLVLRLTQASGARIADGEATGTIENADPLPAAWLARFGRMAAGQVLAAVGERLRGGGQTQATVAGRRLQGADAEAVAEAQAAYERAWAERLQEGRLQERPRALALRDLVAGSSFSVAADAGAAQAPSAEPGGRWTVWGRGAWSHFAGSADGGELQVDGDVVTATAGADYERGAVLAGLALAYSTGSGAYDHDSERSGTVASTLLSVHPYARLALHERLAVWGLFGYGLVGHLALDDAAADAIETGTGLLLGAFGVDGVLLAAAQSGGLELAARADGLLLRMSSAAATGLAASEADLSRWRLLLEASYAGLPLLGGELRPAVAVGGRYDAGAAETGAGLVLSGRVSYVLPAWGLTLSAGGEGLLVHEEEGFREWGAGGSLRFDPGAPGRGLALSVAPSWGVAGSGAGRLWALPDAASLAPAAVPPSPGARLAAELSYGLDAPGAAGALTPYAGVALAAGGARTWRLGTRLRLDSGLAVSLEGTRAEPVSATARHTLAFAATLSW